MAILEVVCGLVQLSRGSGGRLMIEKRLQLIRNFGHDRSKAVFPA